MTSKTAFEAAGGGSVLDERVEKGGKGSGFGKQAGRWLGFRSFVCFLFIIWLLIAGGRGKNVLWLRRDGYCRCKVCPLSSPPQDRCFKNIDQICIAEPPPEPELYQAPHDDGSADSEREGEAEGFDERCVHETDAERLKMMQESMGEENMEALRDEYEDNIVLVSDVSGTFTDSEGVRGAGSGKEKNGELQVGGPSQTSSSLSSTVRYSDR